MPQRRCFVQIDRKTRKVLGRVVEGEREVKTQAWYLGRMIEQHPDVVLDMVKKKYADWALAYGISPEQITIEFGPLPQQRAESQ